MRWLILAEAHSSLENFLKGAELAQGSPAPLKFVQFLIAQKEEVILVVPMKDGAIDKKNKSLSKLKIIPLPYKLSWQRISNSIGTYYKLKEIIKKERPDLLYSTGYNSIVASISAKKYKLPCFSRFLGTFLTQLFEGGASKVKYFPKLLAELFAFKLSKDGLIITDDGTKGDVVCQKLGIKQNKILFIRNGVDKNFLEKIRLNTDTKSVRNYIGLSEEDFIVTNISRLASWKRVDLVILGFNQVVASLSNDFSRKIALLIIGSGRREKELKRLAMSLPCREQVHFLDNLKHRMAMEVMYSSDVITSCYEISNVGNVLLEALSLGKIIIARNTGATGKIIKNGENGFLVSKNPDQAVCEFHNFVLNIIQNDHKQQLDYISKNALQWAGKNITGWEERLFMEYKWILNRLSIKEL